MPSNRAKGERSGQPIDRLMRHGGCVGPTDVMQGRALREHVQEGVASGRGPLVNDVLDRLERKYAAMVRRKRTE